MNKADVFFHKFSGDMFERLNTPYGFFRGSDFYVNVKDYQGNIIANGGEAAAGVAQSPEY